MGKDTCVVCGKKLGWRGGYTLDIDYPEVMICGTCYDHKEIVNNPDSSEGFYSTSLKKFINAYNSDGISDDERACLNSFIEKARENRKANGSGNDETEIETKIVFCPQCRRLKLANPETTCFCGGKHIDIGIDFSKWTFMTKEEKADLTEQCINKYQRDESGIVFTINGALGKSMKVYSDRCVFIHNNSVVNEVFGLTQDGEKTIFFSDCLGVQLKAGSFVSGYIGYIQIETAAVTMNDEDDKRFNENTLPLATSSSEDASMYEIYRYIVDRVAEYKKDIYKISRADEIRKFSDLLKEGIITSAEYDKAKLMLLK